MTELDDEDARYLRARLATVTPPAGRLSADGLLAAGRRAGRRRRTTATALGALLPAAALVLVAGGFLPWDDDTAPLPGPAGTPTPSVSPATAACTLERLPLPSGATSGAVLAGSPNGRHLVGSFQRPGIANLPAWWVDGRLRQIPVEADAMARDVNDSGTVVGDGPGPDGKSAPWAYVDGKLVWLPIPPGFTSGTAHGINARGDVVGSLGGEPDRAVVWRDTSTSPRADLLSAPEAGAYAIGISDSGVVIGGLFDAGRSGSATPYRWDADGQGAALPLPAGVDRGSVRGIRGNWAHGTAAKSNGVPALGTGPPMPVLWDLEKGTATIVDGGMVIPGAGNARGQLLLHRDGIVLLRDPDGTQRKLPGEEGWRYGASALDDSGDRIAGSGGARPVHWNCRD
ncbi:hypothetical protein C6361_11530 [Plantactinospora sp. BC1]|uniref:hypothetical protein n=1 Tax=Plantactinospora sp. BC1 TaxID=2108470 RepID=UPI000D15A83E|nr:hypothetical protein [Plantactinospora sp. BC1]AVT30021.1 hypothetical protein C6361_11530 [Plantactinospora sp. BC1]